MHCCNERKRKKRTRTERVEMTMSDKKKIR